MEIGMAKPSGGRRFSRTCLVKGCEAEGRKAIIKTGGKHTRVAPIREDGLTGNGAVVVANSLILDIRPVEEDPAPPGPLSGIVGERGNIVLPAALRRRRGLETGSAFLLEEREGEVVIRPADVIPRQVSNALEGLLSGVTADNIHDEVPTGNAMGGEAW
jgi:AbrB family looped-hinge helix DNA binding protein